MTGSFSPHWAIRSGSGYAMLIHALAKEAAGNRLEVTPQSLRIRKFRLDENERKRAAKRMQEA